MDPAEQVSRIQQQHQQHVENQKDLHLIREGAKGAAEGYGAALFLKWLFGRRG